MEFEIFKKIYNRTLFVVLKNGQSITGKISYHSLDYSNCTISLIAIASGMGGSIEINTDDIKGFTVVEDASQKDNPTLNLVEV
jgi:small nuclear ribonucleoprotein (snRNP)-like protein